MRDSNADKQRRIQELAAAGKKNGAKAPPKNGAGGIPVVPEAAKPEPLVRCCADLQTLPVRWLWDPYLLLDALTVLDGDPGLGKSTLTLDIAARVSRGWAMPPEVGDLAPCTRDAGGVLLLSAEDHPERIIRPRLEIAGADLARVHLFEGLKVGEDERPPIIPCDLDWLEASCRTLGVLLVVIDPFMAYLGADVDSHSDQDVRRALHRLKILAERTGICLLLVRHLNKMQGGSAIYRGGGSIGITGSARSALVVGRDPADEDRRVLAGVKPNWGPMPPSRAYTTEVHQGMVRIRWGDVVDLSADEVLGGPRRQSVGSQCAAVIRDLLTHPMRVTEFEEALAANGYGERAIRDGRRAAGVVAFRVGGQDGAWMVRLQETRAEI